jgi:hypothetical protein
MLLSINPYINYRNFKLILFLLLLCITGCINNLSLIGTTYTKFPFINTMTYLSNDDSNIYFILYDTVKIKRKLTSKICVYNLKTEASKIIYSSDTLLFISLFQSNEGNCVIFVSLDKHGITYINYLNLLNDKNSIIFHSHHVISNAIISSKQDIIYFTANKYLTEKKYDFNQKIAGNQSIYSINLDGKNLTKLSTFYYLFNSTMYLDKSNENIYFNLESDSVMGPFMLNLTTKKLTSLASTISLNQKNIFHIIIRTRH